MKQLNTQLLSAIIRDTRRAQGVSQEEAAYKLGITRKTYGQKEQRPESLTIKELNKLGRILNTSAAELIAGATITKGE